MLFVVVILEGEEFEQAAPGLFLMMPRDLPGSIIEENVHNCFEASLAGIHPPIGGEVLAGVRKLFQGV